MGTKLLRAFSLAVLIGLVGSVTALRAGDKQALSDEQFIARALSQGIGEVKLSEQAVMRASNQEVKKFAEHMMKDHTRVNAKLLGFARDRKLAVVQGLDKTWRERLEKFSRLEGAAYDRDYMSQQVKSHEQAVKLFEGQARGATNADLKAFAAETVSTIRNHLKKAREIRENLKDTK